MVSLAEIEARFGGWIRARVRTYFPEDCDDVTQDVMMKLLVGLPGLRDARLEPLRAFVSRTTRSVCIDEWRRRAARPRPDAEEAAQDLAEPRAEAPPQAAERAERERAARAAVAALPERERAILRLRFEQGLGFREIAEVLGVPQGSVAGWYSRAVAALRERLR